MLGYMKAIYWTYLYKTPIDSFNILKNIDGANLNMATGFIYKYKNE
jgi:hypothetical protein